MSLDSIDRRADYYVRSADQRARDPVEFARRMRIGLQVQAYQRLTKQQRADARSATPAANVVQLRGRARR